MSPPPSPSPPSHQSLTPVQFTHLLSLYPKVLQRVYERKIKDAVKRAQALEDDAWRYGYGTGGGEGKGLGEVVQERRGKGGGESEGGGGWIEKQELERLVRWKITHGTSRPFLPAQIRKNDALAVKSATTAAFAAPPKTSTPPTPNNPTADPRSPAIPPFPTLSSPLKYLTTLTGVGPATATLLLSIHDPVSVPFFQDELYGWLCSPGATTKLKYNLKEYEQLYEAVGALRRRLSLGGVGGVGKEGPDGGPGGGVRADEVERVGFVVGYWGDVEDGERMKVLSGGGDGDWGGKRKVLDDDEEGGESEDERVGKRKKRKRGSADGDGEKKKSVVPARKAHRSR